MARQLDNSLVRFARHERSSSLAGLSVTIGICLATGLIMAIFLRTWPFVAVFGISLLGLLIFAYLSSRNTRKLIAAQDEARIEWESALPEIQRQSLNLEVD